MVIFTILSYKKVGPSFLGLLWYWNDPLAGGQREETPQDWPHLLLSTWPVELNTSPWGEGSKVSCLFIFLVGMKSLVLPLLSWKMLLLREHWWCFSLNRQKKRTRWVYCMIRFIYIHPKSIKDIKNELHKKIIFGDNSRPCNPTRIFKFSFQCSRVICGLHTSGTAQNPGSVPRLHQV